MLHFESPLWLFALPAVLLWGTGWGAMLLRNYRKRQRSYADTARTFLRLPAWALSAKLAGHGLLVAAIACLVLALARPQGSSAPSASARRGVNLAILVDGSRSMLCEDVVPSRLQAARTAVENLAVATSGSRFSLFMFGGAPTLLIPQTFDTAAVTLAARSISPDFVGNGGTALDPAIKRAADYLAKSSPGQPKVIVIISDGEEGQGDPILAAMQARTDQGIRIHTLTIGTAEGGPMPLYQRNPKGEIVQAGVLMSQTNQPILTRADPELMVKLAEAGNGRSLQITGGNIAAQVRQFAEQAILPDAVAIDDVATQEPREWFWMSLLAALMLVLAEQALRRWVAYRFADCPPINTREAILLAPAFTGEKP